MTRRTQARPIAALRQARVASIFAPIEDPADPSQALRRLIAESLEDGLLRYSQRRAILDEGRARGFSDFHTHLLIAQVQHGDRRPLTLGGLEAATHRAEERQAAARLAAVTIFALAIVLALIRWLAL